jgi:hypothetical protein
VCGSIRSPPLSQSNVSPDAKNDIIDGRVIYKNKPHASNNSTQLLHRGERNLVRHRFTAGPAM